MENAERELRVLDLPDGRCPFEIWWRGIRDKKARQVISGRLYRVRNGNLGDCKPVGGGVKELRVDFGPGYRIYFAEVGEVIIVLIAGGDKSTQQKDIDRAIEIWEDYQSDPKRFQRPYQG